ncbi:MAG: DUF438 domain-containing protein [Erysipelothrix sp.]|nr:DUF438 domain-containing protein [Erysipelothrix sp.]
MSELINSTTVEDETFLKRQEELKKLILRLHAGESEDVVKEDFRKHFGGVSSYEIAQMEKSLMQDEGLEIEQVQLLCSVHANIFKGSIDEVHTVNREHEKVGHPVRVMREENYALKNLLESLNNNVRVYLEDESEKYRMNVLTQMNLLWDIDKHYTRKENTFFPLMEKNGLTAPPKVMWAVDDDIRLLIKNFKLAIENKDTEDLLTNYLEMEKDIIDMISKEEDILIPMVLDIFTEDDWLQIAEDSIEIGYCIVAPEEKWRPSRVNFVEQFRYDQELEKAEAEKNSNNIHFDIGFLNKLELEHILNSLPIDMTFIDANDTVKYFNQAEERFFARTKSVIGRTVQNCHPPHSVNTVERILNDFKDGTKDTESFWLPIGDAFIHISYYAIRDKDNTYLGTLEVSQNIAPLKALEGSKKLLED